MSRELFDIVIDFILSDDDDMLFASRYMCLWKKERDSGVLILDEGLLSMTLSTIFIFADNYSDEQDIDDNEMNIWQLKKAIKMLLIINGFTPGEIDMAGLPVGACNILESYMKNSRYS